MGRAVKNGAAQEEREMAGDAGPRRSGPAEMRKEGEEEKMGRGRIERAGRLAQNERGRKEGEKNCFSFFFSNPFQNPI